MAEVVDSQRLDCKHRGRCLAAAARYDMPAMSCRAAGDGEWCAAYERMDGADLLADVPALLTVLAGIIERRPCLGCRRLQYPWALRCEYCGHEHYKAVDNFKSPKAVLLEDGSRWRRTR